jgi:hypothetical protein
MEDCGFARIAHTILVDEQRVDKRKNSARKLLPAGLAGVLKLPSSTTYAMLSGGPNFSPSQARAVMAYTSDPRLPQWLLANTPFVAALRPEAIAISARAAASIPKREDARLQASAHTMMQEAYGLLMVVLEATEDRVIDDADRANLRNELADLEVALATLRVVLDGAGLDRGV